MNIPGDLYREICGVMPIACVDLLVTDPLGRVLLVKRKNEPAAGQWWFPGGRVHLNETRRAAAGRKLKEECRLEMISIRDLGTYDLIFKKVRTAVATHGITTVFHMQVADSKVCLDDQSETSDWRLPKEWESADLQPFILGCIKLLSNGNQGWS